MGRSEKILHSSSARLLLPYLLFATRPSVSLVQPLRRCDMPMIAACIHSSWHGLRLAIMQGSSALITFRAFTGGCASWTLIIVAGATLRSSWNSSSLTAFSIRVAATVYVNSRSVGRPVQVHAEAGAEEGPYDYALSSLVALQPREHQYPRWMRLQQVLFGQV